LNVEKVENFVNEESMKEESLKKLQKLNYPRPPHPRFYIFEIVFQISKKSEKIFDFS
jgi:hypothetical protein